MAPVATKADGGGQQRKEWIKAPFALHPSADEMKRGSKPSTPAAATVKSDKPPVPALKDFPEPTCKDVKQCIRPEQALCTQCVNRHGRNVPVYFHDERERKELEQANMLQQFQHMKDLEAIENEQKNKQKQRQENMKVAAFNRGVADAVWEEKHKRNTKPDGIYIFKNRPLTPGKHGKQMAYNKALEGQLKGKHEQLEREKHDTAFYERLQLAQLQDSLNEEKDKKLQSKMKNMKNYSVALDAQIQTRQAPLPKAEPDSVGPIFGVHDEDPVKIKEEKERYRDYFKSQLKEADERRKKALQDKLAAKQEGEDFLARTKAERCCLCERDVKNTGQSHIIPNTKFVA